MTIIFLWERVTSRDFLRSRCYKRHLLPPVIKPLNGIRYAKYEDARLSSFVPAPGMTVIFLWERVTSRDFFRSRCRKGHLLPPVIEPFNGILLTKYEDARLLSAEATSGMTVIFLRERVTSRDFLGAGAARDTCSRLLLNRSTGYCLQNTKIPGCYPLYLLRA